MTPRHSCDDRRRTRSGLRRLAAALLALQLGVFGSDRPGWVATARADASVQDNYQPVADDGRPEPLRSAKFFVPLDGQPVRLRAELLRVARPCTRRGERAPCLDGSGVNGRLYLSRLQNLEPIDSSAIEQVWLVRSGQVWTSQQIRRVDARLVEFSDGPPWPAGQPIDVIVRLRGVDGLLIQPQRSAHVVMR